MKFAAITMQKNEAGVLRHWLQYYAKLCSGFENLYIFDDASTDEQVIEQLLSASAKGSKVFWNHGQKWKLEDKGLLVSNLIQELGTAYDWYFPVDCDELVCFDDGERPNLSRDAVVNEIIRASAQGHVVLRINSAFVNIPHTENIYRDKTKKVAVRGTGKNPALDPGFHLYDWSKIVDQAGPDIMAPSKLAHLHFHFRPFLLAIRFAREKLKNRVPSFDKKTIENYTGGGYHLKPYFLMSEDEYLSWFAKKSAFSIRREFDALGLSVPYSEPRMPIDAEELQMLLDPENPMGKSSV